MGASNAPWRISSSDKPLRLTGCQNVRWNSLVRSACGVAEKKPFLLRVDRDLPWRELAMVMTEGGESLPEAELTKISARLRKRFPELPGSPPGRQEPGESVQVAGQAW